MKSWNVFIDTSIFISSNFDLESKAFSSLRSLNNSGHVNLVLTDITVEEIKANLLKSITAAKSIIKTASSKARVLRNLDADSYRFLFEKFDKENIIKILETKLATFILKSNVVVIKATEITPKEIFNNYFQCNPPFGKGKKKSEFPDAFVIAALCEWCERNNEKIHVVSGDPDFMNAIAIKDRLEYYPSLSKLLDIILADENVVISIIHDQMKCHSKMVFDSIADKVKEYEMLVEDADPDAEAFVEDVEVIEITNESVVQISENKATIEADVNAHLEIDVNCYDPDSWYKDDDDKMIYYRDKIEDIFEREMNFEVEFDIQFNKAAINEFKITRVVVNKGNLLSFYLNGEPDYF